MSLYQDNRPKVLNFARRVAGLQIAAQQSILWPCHMYRISIPVRPQKALNIFEETVLKLCAVEKGNLDKLVDITCMDKEIVQFICYRLGQLNLLTSRFELTDDAKALLRQWDNQQEVYDAAAVYVDLVTGTLLPVVTSGQVKLEAVREVNGDFIIFDTGSTGKSYTIKARRLRPRMQDFGQRIPTAEAVAKAVRTQKRLHKKFAILTGNSKGLPVFNSHAEAITFQYGAEVVYLHVQVMVQKGNPDLIVTHPFGYGFSALFKDALVKLNEPWLINLKEKAFQEKITADATCSKVHLPLFGNGLDQYPVIKNCLMLAETNWVQAVEAVGTVTTSSQEQELRQVLGKTVKYLYDAVEWTFRQVVVDHSVEQWEEILQHQSFKDNARLLQAMAEKIGFYTPATVLTLLQVTPGKIKALADGAAELQPLLALALAGAVQASTHPFHLLAIHHRDCLAILAQLKSIRDDIAHGQQVVSLIDTVRLEYYRHKVHQIILNLYPMLKREQDFNGSSHDVITSCDVDQQRLQARVNLDRSFGLDQVTAMPPNLLEELLRIELFVAGDQIQSDEAVLMMTALAAVMQQALFMMYRDYGSARHSTQIMAKAHDKAVQAGFGLSDGVLPVGIATVNTNRALQACRGKNITLGANSIAMLVVVPADKLKEIAQALPDLLNLSSKLSELRGHANNFVHHLTLMELMGYKEKVYAILNYILRWEN